MGFWGQFYNESYIMFLTLLLEPFIESLPTFILLFSVLVIIAQKIPVEGDIENAMKLIAGDPTFYYIKITISFLTLSFGMTKYLKCGPCRIVPNEGRLGGYGECGFILLYLKSFLTILQKINIPLFLFITTSMGANNNSMISGLSFNAGVGIWIGLNVGSQFIYVSGYSVA